MEHRQAQAIAELAAVVLGLAAWPLWAGTEGASSTFYGLGAGSSGSGTSGFNTLVGVDAGNHNTGSNSAFLGYQAGYTNTTGFDNTFLGFRAGFSNTIGNANAFIGSGAGYANTTGANNSFLGYGSGSGNTTGHDNTFLGLGAGGSNTTGNYNTYVGENAGTSNTTGSFNTFLGTVAGGLNTTGQRNVFLGYAAGNSETGSNKLYIDNCLSGNPCSSPLIYGEFDNHLLNINGVISVAANGAAKSQMHFSLDNGDYGGFLTSVLPNNFFVSSGARFDSPNWVQRSADGNAVMAGSGGSGYRIFTHTGASVGSSFSNLVLRLQIDYSGQFGINTVPVAGHEIHTGSGAYLAAGTWTDASSRAYKHDIHDLSGQDAAAALASLNPVRFRYNDDDDQQHVGFIAEDVPELVAMKDRKGLSPMDIVAVLTKVVQEQRHSLEEQRQLLEESGRALESVRDELASLRMEVKRIASGRD